MGIDPVRSAGCRAPQRPCHRPARLVALLAGAALTTAAACGSAEASDAAPQALSDEARVVERAMVEAVGRAQRSVVAIARVRADRAQPPGRAGDAWELVAPQLSPTDPAFIPNEFGSGVVIDARGLILTNYHVLGDPDENRYFVWSERRPFEARVQAADPWMDVAVLKVEAEEVGDGFEPIVWGDASRLRQGQVVIALGNPYAIARDGLPSASWGIVSNLERQAPRVRPAGMRQDGRDTIHHFGTLIQTDARLEWGSSGGALIDLDGRMVGLTTSLAALEGAEQPGGFALPADEHLRRAVESLKAGRKAEYGFLGIQPRTLELGDRQRGRVGVLVFDVEPGTPAARAGLRPGELLTHVNGSPVYDDQMLIRDISRLAAGAQAELTVERGGRGGRSELRTVQVALAKRYVGGPRPTLAAEPARQWRGLQVEYATALPQFLELSQPLDPDGCVGLLDVQRDSAAWRAGLRPGDLVSHVEEQRVTTPEEFWRAIDARDGPVQLRLVGRFDRGPLRVVE